MSQTQVVLADPLQISSNEDQLFVNDGPLDAQNVGYLQPTSLETPLDEIRRRLKEDGHVLLKGLLPREDVLQAREKYFELLSPTGVLKPGTAPVDGIFDPEKDHFDYPGIGAGHYDGQGEEFINLALKAHKESWYIQFCQHPALLEFVAKLTGWGDDTLSVRRTLLRNNTPKNKAIGVHYDQIFLRHGNDSVLTAWVPMGNIKLNGGGLIYLEKGHALGEEIEKDFTNKAKEAGMTDEEAQNAFNKNMMSGGVLSHSPATFGRDHDRKWLVTDYEVGDVVIHSSYAIHASTINHDEDGSIRLGTDLRFVNSKHNWDTRWANSYELDDGV